MGCSNIWARFNWTEKNQKVVELNNNLDEEKIEKKIKDFYKILLNREPDIEGLNYYTKLVQKNSLTMDEVYNKIQNSSEVNKLKNTKIDNNRVIFKSKYTAEEIKKYFEENDTWYHSFNINGIQNKNTTTSFDYQMWVSQMIPNDLTGKTILDLGCSDGFYSFLCEQRNANRILATDHEEFQQYKKWYSHKNNIELCKHLLDSKIEYKKLDVNDVNLLKEKFDLVLFFGLYYHLTDIISALKKIYSVVNETVFLAGHILDSKEPIMYYYDISDHNSFCQIVASPQCLINIAKNIGFKTAKLVDTLDMPYERTYPHFLPGTKIDKIGLFEFSK